MGMGPVDETGTRRDIALTPATQQDSQQQTGKDSAGSSTDTSSSSADVSQDTKASAMPGGAEQMELAEVPPFKTQNGPASNGNSSSSSSSSMPPPAGAPLPRPDPAGATTAPGCPNTNETDEPPNSSPARSSAAMALASMFHIKPVNPNDSSKVGYAFPLDDNHPLPGTIAPPPTTTAATGRRAGSSGSNKRGGNGSRKGSPALSLGEATAADNASLSEPARKRERRSPLNTNAAEAAANWGRQQAEAGGLMPNGHHHHGFGGHPPPNAVPYGSPLGSDGDDGGTSLGELHPLGGSVDDASEGSRRSGRRSSASHASLGSAAHMAHALLAPPPPPPLGPHGLPLPPPGVLFQDGTAIAMGMFPPHPAPPPFHPPPFIGGDPAMAVGAEHTMPTMPAHIPPVPAGRKKAAGAGGGGGGGAHGGAAYNRKEKSLGLLCENFIKQFGEPALEDPEHEGISLDQAAKDLNVERRRIYDIINILESICYVERKCKNTYWWYGPRHLASTLKQLQGDALQLWPEDARRNGVYSGAPAEAQSPQNGPKTLPEIATSQGQAAVEAAAAAAATAAALEEADRKEKSLGRLSQKFIQLFLVGFEVISLSGAAEKLLGASPQNINEKGMKTKVRRLYDIANVLTSLRLIDKIQVGDSRKPSFRWVGTAPTAVLSQPPFVIGGAAQYPGVPGLTPQETRNAVTQAATERRQRGGGGAAVNMEEGKPPAPPAVPAVAGGGGRGRRASRDKAGAGKKEEQAKRAASASPVAAQEEGGVGGVPPPPPQPPLPPAAPPGPFITTGDATAPLITTTGHAHGEEVDVHGLMPLAPTPSPPALPPPPPPGLEGSGGPPSGGSGSGGMGEMWMGADVKGEGKGEEHPQQLPPQEQQPEQLRPSSSSSSTVSQMLV